MDYQVCWNPHLVNAYNGLSSEKRSKWASTLARAVAALFRIELPSSWPEVSSLEKLMEQISREFEGVWLRGQTTDQKEKSNGLLAFLVTERRCPSMSLVQDLAEILYLPREHRSEYLEARGGTPPFRIRKLLLEYAHFSIQIDQIIGELTKDFCAKSCARLPIGCCRVLGYDLGLVPDVMLDAQVAEAKLQLWQEPSLLEERCKFHTDTGCAISMFKTPACIGFMCDELNRLLEAEYPQSLARSFISALTELRNRDIDREEIFLRMQRVISAGEDLLFCKSRS